MSWVKARSGESIDNMLKRFKKAVENSGVLSDFRRHERYEKPSVKRKRKQAAASKRALKIKKKLERFEKPKMGNWKWNKDHTKKITLRTYTTSNSNRFRSKNTTNRPYKGNKPKFTNKVVAKGNKR